MAKEKLAPPKDYKNRPVDKWLLASFQAYLKDKCFEMFQVTYAPFHSYAAEGKMIKTMIEQYGPEFVKRFIDETFAAYKPTAKYPATSAGFMMTYRKSDIQRIERDIAAKNKTQEYQKKVDTQKSTTPNEDNDLLSWI